MAYQRVKEEREAQMEIENMRLEMEMEKIEVQARFQKASTGSHSEAHAVNDETRDLIPPRYSVNEPRVRGQKPKMSPSEEKDNLDAYVYRFELYAELQGWSRDS